VSPDECLQAATGSYYWGTCPGYGFHSSLRDPDGWKYGDIPNLATDKIYLNMSAHLPSWVYCSGLIKQDTSKG